jgi:hypothetical protein
MPFFFTDPPRQRPTITKLCRPNGIIDWAIWMRVMNDLCRDWKRWTKIEQVTVTVAAVASLMIVAIGLA